MQEVEALPSGFAGRRRAVYDHSVTVEAAKSTWVVLERGVDFNVSVSQYKENLRSYVRKLDLWPVWASNHAGGIALRIFQSKEDADAMQLQITAV